MKKDTSSSSKYVLKALHSAMTDVEWMQIFEFKKEYAALNNLKVEYPSWQAVKEQYRTQLKQGVCYILIWKKERAFGTLAIYEKRKTGKEYSFLKHNLPIRHFDQEILEKNFDLLPFFLPRLSVSSDNINRCQK